MDVRQWMKRSVYSVKPLDTVLHAREVMISHRVNQLPVMVDGALVGIVTDRDLRDAFPSVFQMPGKRRKVQTSSTDPGVVSVEMVMTAKVMIVGPTDTMGHAAQIMRRERIGALPVVEAHRVVGIVTRSDVLDCFLDLSALEENREGSTFTAAAPRPGKRAQR